MSDLSGVLVPSSPKAFEKLELRRAMDVEESSESLATILGNPISALDTVLCDVTEQNDQAQGLSHTLFLEDDKPQPTIDDDDDIGSPPPEYLYRQAILDRLDELEELYAQEHPQISDTRVGPVVGTRAEKNTTATKKRGRDEVDDTDTAAPVASTPANGTRSTTDSRKKPRVATEEEPAEVSTQQATVRSVTPSNPDAVTPEATTSTATSKPPRSLPEKEKSPLQEKPLSTSIVAPPVVAQVQENTKLPESVGAEFSRSPAFVNLSNSPRKRKPLSSSSSGPSGKPRSTVRSTLHEEMENLPSLPAIEDGQDQVAAAAEDVEPRGVPVVSLDGLLTTSKGSHGALSQHLTIVSAGAPTMLASVATTTATATTPATTAAIIASAVSATNAFPTISVPVTSIAVAQAVAATPVTPPTVLPIATLSTPPAPPAVTETAILAAPLPGAAVPNLPILNGPVSDLPVAIPAAAMPHPQPLAAPAQRLEPQLAPGPNTHYPCPWHASCHRQFSVAVKSPKSEIGTHLKKEHTALATGATGCTLPLNGRACGSANFQFKTSYSYAQHLISHHKITGRPWQCPFAGCSMSMFRCDAVMKHMREKHHYH